jgi:pimeloyl-ACP methyl ester carboxylesterase
MQHISSRDGTMIGFRRSGAGRPLLLVHGTTADHRRWSALSPHFERNFTVYAMDRRGRGGSGDAPDYDIMREAEDVAALVQAIGEPVFVLGHSYGGLCSLEAALLTDRMSRLILYEPPVPTGVPIYPTGVPEQIQALVDKRELEAALELFMRAVVRMPDHELETYRQLPMWKERIRLAPTISRELAVDRTYRFNAAKFAGLQVPTMLLLGGDSPPPFRQAIEMVNAALPDSRIIIMPGQRHIAMDTHPELFLKEALQFLGYPSDRSS